MDRVADYLIIPTDYLRWLNGHDSVAPFGNLEGIHWSASGDAIEYPGGTTFAFSSEIALFLEGLGSAWPLPHFGYVLHLLHILRHGCEQGPAEAAALSDAFMRTGRPMRNAGVFCAHLIAKVAAMEEPIEVEAICRQLASPALMNELCTRWALRRRQMKAPKPALGSAAFENILCKALAGFHREDLDHWFRHGRGPLDRAGEHVAQEVVAVKPRSLDGVLATLAQRERFAGAVPFVSQLVSALSLPPRRLAHQELPLGGYADLATRGHPEQILPSQFALEDLEFLRRFAEHELLFFRREEPQSQTREELVVVLDQGVRTWGDVRLVLSAAVLAFGKAAGRRKIPFRIATSSSGGELVDPLEVDDDTLGNFLEASDLTAHPGLALERVLEEPAQTGRDVVLLTHPRNFLETDVEGAARRLPPGTRLFGVGVDAHGGVLLAELKHGAPVKICQFQVDLTLGAARTAPRPPDPVLEPLAPWKGHIEPIGFPFRFGLTSRVEAFDLDHAGEWLLTASHQGVLHAWKTDGTRMEVLPRGMLEGKPLTQVDRILGVAGGLSWVDGWVLGWWRSTTISRNGQLPAYWLGLDENHRAANWFYFREFHTLVAANPDIVAAYATACHRGIDLATGKTEYDAPAGAEEISRLAQALAMVSQYTLPPPLLPVLTYPPTMQPRGPYLGVDRNSGTIFPCGLDPAWERFTPRVDSRPLLEKARLWKLAVATGFWLWSPRKTGLRYPCALGPEGTPLAEYPTEGQFALTARNRLLARLIGPNRIEVRDAITGGVPLLVTMKGKAHQRLHVRLGKRLMTVRVGNHGHLINWNPEELQMLVMDPKARVPEEYAYQVLKNTATIVTKVHLPPEVQYDPKRFTLAAQGDVSVVSDAYGQLAVLDQLGDLICMFFVFRDQAGAWMPDGTRYGPPSITGGPPTPGARAKLGRALREACTRNWRAEP